MSQESFPPRISELRELIEANCAEDLQGTLDHCEVLEQYAYEVDSNELRAYCQFYKGLTYYLHALLDKGYDLLTRSIEPLSQTEQWSLVAKTYNALGNISYFQGEFSLAVDHFFVGIRFCKQHDLTQYTYHILNNIADMYMALGEYRLAAEELKICAQGIENNADTSTSSFSIVYGNLASCYIHLGELEQAEFYLKKAESVCDGNLFDRCSLLFLQTAFYHRTGDTAKRDETIKALRSINISPIVYDFLNELEHHARLLLEIECYDAVEELYYIIDAQVTSLFAKETLCKLRLEYYQKIDAQQKYLEECARFYEITMLRDRQRRQISVHNIMSRSYLEKEVDRRAKTEEDNTILRERSEKDALTGIKNRFKLNEVAEAAFQRAYMNGTLLGVELLDIDYYKEYNDNYGHQAGDECLIAIARLLQELEQNKGIHVGRYGGDEFMIIYEGYSKEEVLDFAAQIKARLAVLQVEHKHSRVAPYVTVSQGIFLKVPVGTNRLWDFTYCADLSLYYVKGKSRNNLFLSTSAKEIKEFAGDDYRLLH